MEQKQKFSERYPTFQKWMKAVNRCVIMRCGASADDLADQPYQDWFESQMDPQEAALFALEDEGFPLELVDPDDPPF
jgi:hypothetical protein